MFTTDTRKEYCPIYLTYTSSDDPAHVLRSECDMYRSRGRRALAVIKATEYSDYSGCSVPQSNYRVLAERFPWLVSITGSHGAHALAYDAYTGPIPPSEELSKVLDGLEQYPLVDDDDHTSLEEESETVAWEDHGSRDFRRALEQVLDRVDHGHAHDCDEDDSEAPLALRAELDWFGLCSSHDPCTLTDFYRHLWCIGVREFNINGGSGCAVMTGCSVHFYVDEWMRGERSMQRSNPSERRLRLQAILTKLAELTRS